MGGTLLIRCRAKKSEKRVRGALRCAAALACEAVSSIRHATAHRFIGEQAVHRVGEVFGSNHALHGVFRCEVFVRLGEIEIAWPRDKRATKPCGLIGVVAARSVIKRATNKGDVAERIEKPHLSERICEVDCCPGCYGFVCRAARDGEAE